MKQIERSQEEAYAEFLEFKKSKEFKELFGKPGILLPDDIQKAFTKFLKRKYGK